MCLCEIKEQAHRSQQNVDNSNNVQQVDVVPETLDYEELELERRQDEFTDISIDAFLRIDHAPLDETIELISVGNIGK